MPDFRAQFRNQGPGPRTYMGGTTIGCGQHPTTPKRHRWGAWQAIKYPHATGYERTCLNCGLVSDMRWTKPEDSRP